MAKKATIEASVVSLEPIKMRNVILFIVGTHPLIMHRFAQKAWQELLLPSAKKNAAERASTLKHEPMEEYRGCFYRNRDPKQPALFHLPNGMLQQAIAAAALDIPGVKRTESERWISVVDLNVNLFGIPQMYMSMVRNSDMNKTPDVRTRPIFPEWACKIDVCYKVAPLNDKAVINLAAGAGQIVGLGDWRPQKGGPYGKFRLCEHGDKDFTRICKEQGRKEQQRAFDTPTFYDLDTEDLMSWFTTEVARRRQDDDGEAVVASPVN